MRTGLGIGTLLLLSQTAKAQSVSVQDQKYIEQVASDNLHKTNAKVITLHVQKVKNASSAETTDAEKREKFAGLKVQFTLVVGESNGIIYQFKSDDSRADRLQIGQDYTVILGMASLDMKKHKYNVKERDSAVIFVPSGEEAPVQFRLRIDSVEEKQAR